MLSSDERRVLAGLETDIAGRDHRFANGLRDGRPRAPGEFRWRRLQAVTSILAVLSLAGTGWLVVVSGTWWAAAGWPLPVAAIVWSARGWRYRRRLTHSRPTR